MKIRGQEKRIGKLAAFLIRVIGCTLRITVDDRARVTDPAFKQPMIWTFWHNRMFLMPWVRETIQPALPAAEANKIEGELREAGIIHALIGKTIAAKVLNSSCLQLSNGFLSKKGITFWRRSDRRRTTNTSVLSFDPRWFSRSDPQPRSSRARSKTLARATSWLIRNSGTICQPALVQGFLWIAT